MKSKSKDKQLSNHEIVTLAVYLLGGETQRIDTEDIAVKANEIAPGRFAWRKYPKQINIDVVRKRLWDATKPEKGEFLFGTEKEGWLLTNKGMQFSKKMVKEVSKNSLSGSRLTTQQRRWLKSERIRLLNSQAYEKFKQGMGDRISPKEAEAFFKVDDYVLGEMRKRMVKRIENAFSQDKELGEIVRALADLVRDIKK
jgi:hypothetical protein